MQELAIKSYLLCKKNIIYKSLLDVVNLYQYHPWLSMLPFQKECIYKIKYFKHLLNVFQCWVIFSTPFGFFSDFYPLLVATVSVQQQKSESQLSIKT